MEAKDEKVAELGFRMDLVEREIIELKAVVKQQMHNDAEFRRTLEKAMFELMNKLDATNDRLSDVIVQMQPMIEDYRERAYGKSYVVRFFSNAKYMAALALAAMILLGADWLPKIVALLK